MWGTMTTLLPWCFFSDAERSVYLADMTGDGLSDIVRITHNSVCYWPNLGYGRFGEKVLMANPPLLDAPDRFNPARIRLTDIDGTGTTDIVYLNAGEVAYYKNQAGNTWSDKYAINAFPAIDNLSQVSVTDLMGNGTSCLVWSSPLPQAQPQLRFVELTSGIKPYLLTSFENGLGRKVSLQYSPSTKFFMQDKVAGKPWITRLPFPVQVLERVEDHEQVSDTKLISRYAYHHGHYDVYEREFRGFGMVEQWDTESLADTDEGYQPPVYTKSWFHTGVYNKRDSISALFAQEYFSGDTQAWQLPDTEIPEDLTPEEEREACRALRGQLLRSEVYAQDGTAKEAMPYLVEEKNMTVKLIQPKGVNKHAVFLPVGNEALSYHYERNADDPRIAHSVTLNTDDYGNVLDAFQIAYPRRDASATAEQQALTVVYTRAAYINQSSTDLQLIGVPCENKVYELGGFTNAGQPLTREELQTAIDEATEIDYTATLSGNVEKRCFQHQKNFFYDEALTGSLALGEIASHALPYKSLTADLTEDVLAMVDTTEDKYTLEHLSAAGYVFEAGADGKPGTWYIPSEVITFDELSFYLPIAQTDAFGNTTLMAYDVYDLMLNSTTDALGNSSTADIDYRLLQVNKLTDPNGNSQEVGFDTMGMVRAVALIGASGEGDTLADPTMQYSYDLDAWTREQQPANGHVQMRLEHGESNTGWMESYEYTGGWGNLVMTKVQAEDGDALQIAGDGSVTTVATTNRWVGNGRTVFNNKGKVVRQYEPYFSTTHAYEAESALTQHGVSPVLYYDPVGRNIRTEMPDGTFTKVEFDPWQQKQLRRQ